MRCPVGKFVAAPSSGLPELLPSETVHVSCLLPCSSRLMPELSLAESSLMAESVFIGSEQPWLVSVRFACKVEVKAFSEEGRAVSFMAKGWQASVGGGVEASCTVRETVAAIGGPWTC